MHGSENHQGEGPPAVQPLRGWIWLLAGTGDGPPLATALRRQGWGVRVSVVNPTALRAYRAQRHLELVAGPLAGVESIAAELGRRPYAAVVDATHPFAERISADLAQACAELRQPLLALERAVDPGGGAVGIARLEDLGQQDLRGERLLLAIGGRRLAAAVAHSPGALHHARLLPTAVALQQAIAAGLPAERLALVRPSRSGWIEAGLLRHWGITAVLARAGGGYSEAVWQRLAAQQNLRLLLLQRPAAQAGLPLQALLARLAAWPAAEDPAFP